MRYEVSFDALEFSALQKRVKGNFDNPKFDSKEAYGKVLFSGWFLVDDPDFCLKVNFAGSKTEIHYLNVNRPDVAKHFGMSSDLQFCGFQFQLNLNGPYIDVAVSYQGIDYTIWRIKESEYHCAEINKVKRLWESFHKISDLEYLSNETLTDKDTKILFSLFSLSDIDGVFLSFRLNNIFDFRDVAEFSQFISLFRDPYWAMDAIKQSSELGFLKIQSPSEGPVCYCVGSYSIEDFNFLLFEGLSIQFYIVQHCANVVIIFPTLYQCIQLNITQWALHAINKIPALFAELKKLCSAGISFPKKSPAKFSGVNVSQSRPYHFLYDYLHGLDYLSSHGVLLNSISISGFDFIEVSSYFDNVLDFFSIDQGVLNHRLCWLNTFYLMPCLQYVNGNYDRGFVKLSQRLRENNVIGFGGEDNLKNEKYDLVFWVGVSTEKRSWIEQTMGIVSVISSLQESYESMLVLIDGRTSTLTGTETTNPIISRENEIFNEISRLSSRVNFVNLVGRTMSEKIFFASFVDIFFTSFATDSMYVSCVHGKKGVVYVAPSIGDQRKIHIHKNAFEIPQQKIREVNAKGKAWHETSVSIDWRDVFYCLTDVLKERN
ncbi:hypothetical protein ACSV5M_12775 [Cellvibrio sp. ARAG 10.3]|uniref:hypothetical protein n=1 Tax=Cellvibrio sp. ARAG 10.3 TaxID=3451358 RepID=UPI003F47B4BC